MDATRAPARARPCRQVSPQPPSGALALMSDKELMPLGRYKGQPVEVALADPAYCEWLTSQPWFQEKHPVVYQTIINYGSAPQDSPEHNQMQVAFLEDAVRLAVTEAVEPNFPAMAVTLESNAWIHDLATRAFPECFDVELKPTTTSTPSFETDGWDVVFAASPATVKVTMRQAPPCTCDECDHDDCSSVSDCHHGTVDIRCVHRKCQGRERRNSWRAPRRGHHDGCFYSEDGQRWERTFQGLSLEDVLQDLSWRPWTPTPSTTVAVELKPDLGDDFPSVLRAIKRRRHTADHRCLIVRRAAFKLVTWEQVSQVFAAEGISLLLEDDLGGVHERGAT